MRACGVQLGIGAAPVRAGGCGGEMRAADTPAKAWGLYLSGLLAAMVAAVWMRPPGVGHSFGRAVAVAAVWMAATVLAGVAGLGVGESFLEGRPAYPRMNFVVGAATTWVLLPPMLLCWVRGSGWAAAISAVAGAVMAACVWGRTPRVDLAEEWEPWSEDPRFAGLPAPDSGRPRAFAIAVCVELAVVLASRGEVFVAMTLSGVAAFLFVWKRMASLDAKARERLARRAVGASAAVLMAMLIVIPLLLARFVRMNGGMETTAQAAARTRADTEKGEAADAYPDGYQGIVLFTVKDKSKELPPVPMERDVLRTGMKKPLVIRFDGSYWYYQAPEHGPGVHPHLTHGDPVAVSIYSTGWVPLAMEAHQTLAEPVDLHSVGAMEVTVRNGDNRRGRIDMGVLLTDSTTPGKPSMYLGTGPIVSTEADHFTFKANPVSEEVRFAIPERRGIRRFDEVTVLFFPEGERATLGARVGIEQFELTPR